MARQLLLAIAAFGAFAAAATTACTTTTAGPTIPTAPADDPFWKPPNNFNDLSAGQVFHCRQVTWNTALGDNSASAFYQYAYKSSLRNGTNVVAVATLIIPTSNAKGAPYSKLVSYQVPYDSPTSYCGPSFAFTANSGPTTMNSYNIGQGSDNATVYALNAGIPVLVSDYESSVAAFGIGISSGLGVLNGIEAVIGYSGLFVDNPKVALWGYSGGALATEFALELATSYTPTYPYTIIGAALGGLTPRTRTVGDSVNNPSFSFSNTLQFLESTLIPFALLGMANEDATVSAWLQSHLSTAIQPGKLSSYKTRFYNAASNNCVLITAFDFASTDFNTWFTSFDGAQNLTLAPTIKQALDLYGVMGKYATPSVPMFWYKGTADEVSPIAETDQLYSKYCSGGANGQIQYQRLSGNTHGGAQTNGSTSAWQYLSQRFDGQTLSPGCSTSTTS